MSNTALHVDGHLLQVDWARPARIARVLQFDATAVQPFGAPAAHAQAMQIGHFSASVAHGASCNCNTITLTPHCNGTHTECVGHLTIEALNACDVAPLGPLPARLLTVRHIDALSCGASVDAASAAGDLVVTRAALHASYRAAATAGNSASNNPIKIVALVVRTRPESQGVYLTLDAALWLVEQHIEHLVVDQYSIDRSDDGGKLSVHRCFFGLPAGSTRLADARRAHCTVTELAQIDDALRDGTYLLQLQVAAIAGDAAPSAPLLFACIS